jgi:phosphoserine aminotransferase
VLDEAQRDLLALPGVGMSVLEISHRSRVFEHIIEQTEEDIRSLGAIPPDYKVLFLQGGGTLQFSMVPMNLLALEQTADYLVTGHWSNKAVEEAKKIGKVHIAATTQADQFSRVPRSDEITLTPGAAYVHMTSNNTIYGTQWRELPDAGGSPLVSDASSDIFSRPIDISRHALIYAGAQKNLGPSGVTIVIMRQDLLERSATSLPSMLSYAVHAENRSLYNTPPVFAVYLVGLVVKWLSGRGGLEAVAKVNERKAAKVYAEIDRSGFYRGTAQKESRSLMNVTFRLATEDLNTLFVQEAEAAGLDGLKGHRAVGGIRASLYNAFPEEGVETLVAFMREFGRRRG